MKNVLENIKRFDLQFSDNIAPGGEGDLTYTFNFPCSIEKMTITFPIGSRNELQLTPYIQRPDLGVEDLITFVGNRYVSGDNQIKPYVPAKRVEFGYTFVVHYKNTGADAHAFDIAVTCDSLYGPVRIDVGRGVARG